MNKIVSKKQLSDNVFRMEIEAALIANERKAGQFIILMIDEALGERIPLTIADADPARGTITMARADGSRRWDLPVVTSRGEGSFRHLVRIPPDVGLLVFAMHADGGGEVEFSDIGAYLLPVN